MEPVKDSIFISSLRSFCKAVAVILGIFIALIPLSLLFFSMGGEPTVESKTTLTILPDANGVREVHTLNVPVILQIDVKGQIGVLNLTSETVENQLVDSRTGFLKNNRVKGVLLYFSTPGGFATDSDNIYRALMAYKKQYNVPVFGYIDGLCASGGMYIASAADRLYCSPSSIVGSVGVVTGPFFNVKEAMTKYGVDAITVTEGKNKDMMNPFRTWRPGEDSSLRMLSAYFYNRFVDIVTQGRPKVNRESLINEYGANVFDPETAERIGFVDGQRDYGETLKELLKTAGIEETKSYQVVTLEPKKAFFNSLVSGKSPLGQLLEIFFAKEKSSSLPAVQQFSYLYEQGNNVPSF